MSFSQYYYYTPFNVEDFNQLFDEVFDDRTQSKRPSAKKSHSNDASRPFGPRLDLHESTENNLVTATFELPGLKKDDVNIDVHDNRLTVSGEASISSEQSQDGYAVRERKFGKFRRSVPLPKGLKPEEITAKMEDGLLTVTFPKVGAEQQPAKITIA